MKILRSTLVLLMSVVLGSVAAAQQNKNVVYQDSQVRMTLVTDGVIRLEWEPDGKFTDLPSFVASERDYPDVECMIRNRSRKVEITTSRMIVSYLKGSGKFNASNLQIKAADGMFAWKPGMKQEANLKGTFRTLDGLDGDLQTQEWVKDSKKGEIRPFEDGVIARDGWTLIDESSNLLFDDSDWAWVKERESKDCIDWYFMAYGHDYKKALKDFTVFAGKMPLPPRFTFGYWWSRYWAYTDKEMRDLVKKFQAYDIPLDVLVVDMDWHYTDPGRGGWTGWTWNRSLFPDPEKFMAYLKNEGLKVTINLHPAEGFEHFEKCYPALAESLGIDPSKHQKIDWVNSDKDFMTNMFKTVMHPMEKEGVDFWWLDWQQHVYDQKMQKLHNTWWINYCYFSDMERNSCKRPLLYHRWGGLGNHRYQIGFSGDATITWKSLEFQPYFTSTASNVLYGYWSHDIGGHLGDSIDPEMYARWLQFGGFSPVMRTHSSKNGALNKEPWVFDEVYTDVIRQTVRQRYEMAPYIYTMARKGYDEGLSLCRPMYYDYPECDEAYDSLYRSQYMFGDDMLVAPVTKPGVDGYAKVNVWLPEGKWYELHTGTIIEGGRVVERGFAIDEYGIYIKAGSVLPFYNDTVMNLNSNSEEITVNVFPEGEGTFLMYEDAGNSKDYAENHATTLLSSSWDGNVQTISIAPRNGTYDGMPSERRFCIKVHASEAPCSVTVNGEDVGYEYLDEGLAFLIDVPVADCSAEKIIKIAYADESPSLAEGIVGKSRRMAKSIEALKFRTGTDPDDDLAMMGTINEAILYAPDKARELCDQFMSNYNNLPEILRRQKMVKESDVEWFLKHCGF